MKSISIHGLDDVLDEMIKEKARKQGNSLNKTIKRLLEEAIGIKPKDTEERKQEYADLFGVPKIFRNSMNR
ncbi:MAG: hypothetical protein HQ517_10260 [SAR324 cluster bacterium]|nr:hypothetical protein [SAR324 cluster bacterium]